MTYCSKIKEKIHTLEFKFMSICSLLNASRILALFKKPTKKFIEILQ